MNRSLLKLVGLIIALVVVLGVAVVGVGAAYAALQSGASGGAQRLAALGESIASLAPESAEAASAQQDADDAGLVITSVAADSPAAQAGLQRGDILLRINDTEVNTKLDLMTALEGLNPGDAVTLTITRGGTEQTLTATLGDQNGRAYLGIGIGSCGAGFGRHWGGLITSGPGAYIIRVVADSPAEVAGLQAGDRIVAVDGTTVDADNTLADLIGAHQPGDTVTLRIARPGEDERDVTATLGDQDGKAYLGVEYFLSGGPKLALPEGVSQGVLVTSVVDDGPAANAGVQAGDVITEIDGQAIGSPSALSDAIAGHQPGDQVTLTVYRSTDQQTLDIQVTLGTHPDDETRAYLGVSTGGFFRRFNRNGGGLQGFPGPFFRFPVEQVPLVPDNEA